MNSKDLNLSAYDYFPPEELIAQTPLKDRALSRMLVLNKQACSLAENYFEDRLFSDLPQYLRPGDCLVLNDTKVIPARLRGKTEAGREIEILLLDRVESDVWECLVKPGRKMRKGIVCVFNSANSGGENDSLLTGCVTAVKDGGVREIAFSYSGDFEQVLLQIGETPLPPYIKPAYDMSKRYQTVYARHTGSAAAPTAGLHFTHEILDKLALSGVHTAYITLHVGLGTFRPVNTEDITQHKMHSERYHISQEAANTINAAREVGCRIIAVGTTAARTLETAADDSGYIKEHKTGNFRTTDIFIYPGYTFRIVDALITNFHLPRSSLLMLISAFAGRERVLRAYAHAISREYRFYSFGDCMFIQ